MEQSNQLIFMGENQPYFLEAHDKVWVVDEGEVEIYSIELDENRQPKSSRIFLFNAKKGDLLFSMKTEKGFGRLTLIAVSIEAKLMEMDKIELEKTDSVIHIKQIENWIQVISENIHKGIPPRVYTAIEQVKTIHLTKGEIAYPPKGILWATVKNRQVILYGDRNFKETQPVLDNPVPVSNVLWIEALDGDVELDMMETSKLINDKQLIVALDTLHHYLFNTLESGYLSKKVKEKERILRKVNADNNILMDSLGKLGSIISKKNGSFLTSKDSSGNVLLDTCRFIGDAVGFEIKIPKSLNPNASSTNNQLFSIAKASNIRVRKIILRGEWWKEENGHLLVFLKESNHPVALIQDSSSIYLLKDVDLKNTKKVTKEIAESLNPVAYMFFYPFDERLDSVVKLWKFAIKGLEKEAGLVALAAFSGSLLGLLTPILSGILFDDVIPQADRGYLVEVVIIMVVLGVVAALLNLIQGVLLLRVETKSNINVQAGLMDHLLRLPATFFKKYAAGDLTMRALGINTIRQILSSTVLTAVLGGTFSVVNLFLLFYYDSFLAWVGIGLAVLAITIIVGIGLLKLEYDRNIAKIQGDIQGSLFEFLSGITKIRVSGSEKRIFAIWAEKFSRLKSLAFSSGNYQNFVEVFNGSYTLFTNLLFFSFIFYSFQHAEGDKAELISVGVFVAFISAFKQFLSQCLSMSMALIGSLNLIPLYERLTPILEAVPESSDQSSDPGELEGDIEMQHINFRYGKGLPLVLKDVTFNINRGEMIAFIGPSGSGKSTIMRLLLGFEEAEAGSIYYDGQEFVGLSKDLVRRQIGVVLQSGSLMAGSIYKNIVGNSELRLEDAWEAAKMAGLKEDIEQMPMGMHTVISEGAGTFSGGQRQRLMIARAIVHKPRLLFMDEATSALDNRTQTIVKESLDRLQATRIVIAHRLTTIINADRIYVMDAGEIVESGTYDELMEKEGMFSELAKRQIA